NKLKKDLQLKDVPLIIISSESSQETFEQHKKLRTRAEDYVHKPIAFGELLQHMQSFVPTIGDGVAAGGEDEILIDDEIEVGDIEDEDEMTQVGAMPEAVRAEMMQKRNQAANRAADPDMDAFADAAFSNLLAGPEGGS